MTATKRFARAPQLTTRPQHCNKEVSILPVGEAGFLALAPAAPSMSLSGKVFGPVLAYEGVEERDRLRNGLLRALAGRRTHRSPRVLSSCMHLKAMRFALTAEGAYTSATAIKEHKQLTRLCFNPATARV